MVTELKSFSSSAYISNANNSTVKGITSYNKLIRKTRGTNSCLSSETDGLHAAPPPRPLCVRLLRECISVCLVFDRVLHGWAGGSKHIYISPIAPKVDAPMMPADMCVCERRDVGICNICHECILISYVALWPASECYRHSGIRIFRIRYLRYLIYFQIAIRDEIRYFSFEIFFYLIRKIVMKSVEALSPSINN